MNRSHRRICDVLESEQKCRRHIQRVTQKNRAEIAYRIYDLNGGGSGCVKERQHEAAGQQEMKPDDDEHQDGPKLGGLLGEVGPERESEDAAGQSETDQHETPLDSRKLK